MAAATEREFRRGRRVVRVTSADRLLFPDADVTKGDLAAYYEAIAPAVLPHLRDRPFTMKRYREGIDGGGFFQKQAPKGMPGWIPTRRFRTFPREGGSRLVDFALVNDELALVWMVQMHCIDLNAWYSRVDRPDRPDYVVFDLDPPDGGLPLAVRVARLIREALAELGLESYVKTSGADGLHVLVPIERRAGYDETYEFAERLARLLEARHEGLVTTEWLKRKRRGVLVDHRQNGWGKTIATVYSVRPRPGAPVSTPLRWEELDEGLDPRRLGMREALERVERDGDLFAPVLEGGQRLSRALREATRGVVNGRPAAASATSRRVGHAGRHRRPCGPAGPAAPTMGPVFFRVVPPTAWSVALAIGSWKTVAPRRSAANYRALGEPCG